MWIWRRTPRFFALWWSSNLLNSHSVVELLSQPFSPDKVSNVVVTLSFLKNLQFPFMFGYRDFLYSDMLCSSFSHHLRARHLFTLCHEPIPMPFFATLYSILEKITYVFYRVRLVLRAVTIAFFFISSNITTQIHKKNRLGYQSRFAFEINVGWIINLARKE